LQANMTK